MVKVSMARSLSLHSLASLLQPQVKSVIGAPLVTQARVVAVDEEEEGGNGPDGGGLSKKKWKTEM